MPEATENIKNKAVNGFKWGLIDNFANSGISFIVGLVLANLLSPEEFGILATITIFINISLTIIDGGFATALIRKVECSESDYNTVFYTNLVVSTGLMALMFIVAPYIASFFNQPILEQVFVVMSFILIINACSIIPKTILVRRIDFRSQAIASLVSSIISGIVGVSLAILGYGVWSLVLQQICRQLLFTLCIWIVIKWRPALQFSTACFIDLFGFGVKLLTANIINTIYKDIFLVVIGKMYSAKDLGYYNRAEQFNQIFSNNLTMILQKVSLPTLSQFQNEPERLMKMFRKFTIFSAIITFPLVFGLAAAAKPIICILVGEKWIPSIILLQIMSLYGAIYPLQQLNINALNIKKRSDLLLKLEILKKFLFIPVILVGIFSRLEFMIASAVLYYYIEFFINGWYSKQLVGYSTINQAKDLLPIYIISIGISAIIWTFTLFQISYYVILLLQVFTAIILYNVFFKLYSQEEYKELKSIVSTQIMSIIHKTRKK